MNYSKYQSKIAAIVKATMEAIESYNSLEEPALNTIRKVLYGQLDNQFREVINERE